MVDVLSQLKPQASTIVTTPSTQAFGDAAAIGSATDYPHADHKHGMPTLDGASAYGSSNQLVTSGGYAPLLLDSENFDSAALHYTSSANLTGTVAKAASSTTLTGTSTLFTTELSVGQVISVPGTATELRVVTAITDNTHLTVAAAFSNTASGQTATRINSALVARQAGRYSILGHALIEGNATGRRLLKITRNRTMTTELDLSLGGNQAWSSGNNVTLDTSALVLLSQWDFLELQTFQDSGSSLNSLAGVPAGIFPSLSLDLQVPT